MDENTILVDIIDRTIPIQNNRLIPVVNKPNPVYGEPVTADQLKQLIQLSGLYIYEAGTKKTINGTNFYDYFPEENPGGGGGSGGGVTKAEVQAMINKSKPVVDSVVSTTSKNAIENGAMTNFVNSSIATNTANYIGLFDSIEELNTYTGTITNNDYAFVVGTDEAGNTKYVRYKYSDSTDTWLEEYTLNNSSYTAEEWAAIQSGIKSGDVEQINTNKTNIETLQTDKADRSELVGKNVTGTEYTIDGVTYTSGEGAEIFNDYTNNVASGAYSHAEGHKTKAIGNRSHTEGFLTNASGQGSHAEGNYSSSAGYGSHAEGDGSSSEGYASHAEGQRSHAFGDNSHAEGNATQTSTSGESAHAEGYSTKATNKYAHAEGYLTKASGQGSHAEGYGTTASGTYSHAEGLSTTSSGTNSHAEGYSTKASGTYSHAEGSTTTASDIGAHAEGYLTKASGQGSHAEGQNTTASGYASHAEGVGSTASNRGAHAEGTYVNDSIISGAPTAGGPKAYGIGSHAEGVGTVAGNSTNAAEGYGSHAEGYLTQATTSGSHSECIKTIASGHGSHAEGDSSSSSGFASHAEGYLTNASGQGSHAEGQGTTASGSQSHSEGYNTKASSSYQHVQGKYNVEDSSGKYAFIIGNGTSDTERSNAFAVDWDGLIYVNNESTGVNVATLATDIETLKTSKANTSDVYTKTETDVKVADIKSDIAINKTTLGTQCKNLLKNTAVTKTISGITFTVNTDGSVTANGTNSTSNYVNIVVFQGELEVGEYILSGTPVNDNICRMHLGLGTADGYGTYLGVDSGNGYTFTVTEKAIYTVICQITNGKTADNITFYPMLRYADIGDDTYEPFAPSLQEQIEENTNNISALNTGVYLYNKTDVKVEISEGYVMRIGNQIHINCKLVFKNDFPMWNSILGLPFKAKIPDTGDIDGTRYTIKNTQSDGRETSIYIDNGKTQFLTSTTFLAGDIFEVKGLILDMYIE